MSKSTKGAMNLRNTYAPSGNIYQSHKATIANIDAFDVSQVLEHRKGDSTVVVLDLPAVIVGMTYDAALTWYTRMWQAVEPMLHYKAAVLVIARQTKTHKFSKHTAIPHVLHKAGWDWQKEICWKIIEDTMHQFPWPCFHLISVFTRGGYQLNELAHLSVRDMFTMWYDALSPETRGVSPLPVEMYKLCYELLDVDSTSTVLDPFAGSGNSLQAALGLGANIIAVELMKYRFNDIVTKVKQYE
ncbi:MAG: site-specific DNA-methyltransferase [Gammaproteobacteria bacterium]|nr:site-specific DNA-methyltransferase [Gammaproteobacteria bacterium]